MCDLVLTENHHWQPHTWLQLCGRRKERKWEEEKNTCRQKKRQMIRIRRDWKRHKKTTRKTEREGDWGQGGRYRGYDRNNTNRKSVSTAEETTSLLFENHLRLSLSPPPSPLCLCLLQNLQHFPFTYFKDNKSGQTRRRSFFIFIENIIKKSQQQKKYS